MTNYPTPAPEDATVSITSPAIPTTSVAGITPHAFASTTSVPTEPVVTGTPNGKLVFAHFMVGIVSTYKLKDWENDMALAKSYGIDGFGLNIGKDPYTESQLVRAYQAAEDLGFKVFMSFDFNSYSINDTEDITHLITKFASLPAQFRLPGTNAAYVTTFAGKGFDWSVVRVQTGEDLHVVPNWQATQDEPTESGVQGLFKSFDWVFNNDRAATNAMGTCVDGKVACDGRIYMAPVSPWYFTHFGKEVPFSKNRVFPSETLWHDRWEEILRIQDDLQFVQIVSWNDYGESHHVGPYDTPHTDDGSSKWAKDMPHDAMLAFSKPYITAFKTGAPEPVIEREMLVYWHRPTVKDVKCDEMDVCGSKPEEWEMLNDEVFVAAFTRSRGTVRVSSGSNAILSKDVLPAVTMLRVPMAPGEQGFQLITDSETDVKGTSPHVVRTTCIDGNYNYNFVSGMLSGCVE